MTSDDAAIVKGIVFQCSPRAYPSTAEVLRALADIFETPAYPSKATEIAALRARLAHLESEASR